MIKNLLFFTVVAASAFVLKITTNKISENRTEIVEEKVEELPRERFLRRPASVKLDRSQTQYKNKNTVRPSLPVVSASERNHLEEPMSPDMEVDASEPASAEEETKAQEDTAYTISNSIPHQQNRSSHSVDKQSTKTGNTGVALPVGARNVSASSRSNVAVISNVALPKSSAVTTPTNPGATVSVAKTLSCWGNISSGAFSNPIAVTLSCSALSAIKYCVSAGGTCCDPDTSGQTYNGKVVIGAEDGTYCLSYKGISSSGHHSTVTHNTYTISSELPDLVVSQEKRFFQTTDMPDKIRIASTDYAKPGYGIGVINLKSHDPGVSGLSMSCEEIVNQHTSLTSPVSQIILNFFDTSGTLVTSQLNVPLMVGHLSYGENYVTTYLANGNFAAPLYSCSTSKITLEDFAFFDGSVIHGETGSNSIREFSGGFSPLGFFEDDSTLYRGPAGEASENLSGQVLETGLFSVIY